MLEARDAVSGATGRNGGHLVSDATEMISTLIAQHGREEAIRVIRFSEANIARLREVSSRLGVAACDAAELRTVVATTGFKDEETLAEAVHAIKLLEELVPDAEIKHNVISAAEGIKKYRYKGIVGCVEQYGVAALWPYRLFTALLESLTNQANGRFSLETSTAVVDITHDKGTYRPYLVKTSRGIIRATKVFHCTNAYAGYLIPNLLGKLYPLRGTMSVQKAGEKFPRLGDQASWSCCGKRRIDAQSKTCDLSLYYAQQNTKTGDIWIGGEVQPVEELLSYDDSQIGSTARQNIASILRRVFEAGEDAGLVTAWSGIMGFTADSLPLVGKLSSELTGRSGDGEWFSGGYNGHGMDKGWLCGEAIARMALGEEAPAWLPSSYALEDHRLRGLTVNRAIREFQALANDQGSSL
ncbi:hypothetical protein ACHAQH_005522 [Verticillium albo-atrum]